MCDASRHTVFEADGRLCCTYCQASVPTRSRHEAEAWLQTSCNCRTTKIGNKYTHHTHSITILKGIVFCVKCGHIATQQLKGLADPCLCPSAAYAQPHAKVNLRRLAKGDLPHGLKPKSSQWQAAWQQTWNSMRDQALTAHGSLF